MKTISIYSQSSIIHLYSYCEEYVVQILRPSLACDGRARIVAKSYTYLTIFIVILKEFSLHYVVRGRFIVEKS